MNENERYIHVSNPSNPDATFAEASGTVSQSTIDFCALPLGGSIMGCCALCCKKGPVAEKKANDYWANDSG